MSSRQVSKIQPIILLCRTRSCAGLSDMQACIAYPSGGQYLLVLQVPGKSQLFCSLQPGYKSPSQRQMRPHRPPNTLLLGAQSALCQTCALQQHSILPIQGASSGEVSTISASFSAALLGRPRHRGCNLEHLDSLMSDAYGILVLPGSVAGKGRGNLDIRC